MHSLGRMTGLPVVTDGKLLGRVERGVLEKDAHGLRGLVVRKGLGAAKWVPSGNITVLGGACVLVQGAPQRLPKDCAPGLTHVYGTSGEMLGMVTDVLLSPETLRVTGLEISYGPVYRLLGQRTVVTRFGLAAGPGDVVAVGETESEREAKEGNGT